MANIKIKVTKKLTNELNKRAENIRFIYHELLPHDYKMRVDYDIFRNDRDYNISSGKMKTIKVVYPPEWYALPRYLTTNDLVGMVRPDDTLESYCERVLDEVTI